MHDLTGFQRDLLGIIGRLGSPMGLDVKEEYEVTYGVRSVNHGRLYPNLDKLAEKGLVEKGTMDDRTNEYSLTPRGVDAVVVHYEWWEETVDRLEEYDGE